MKVAKHLSAKQVQKWRYVISWDNPLPKDSSTMRKALAKLGETTDVTPKTSIALAPKKKTTWRKVRKAILSNLHPVKGKAFYVNLGSSRAFHIGKKTKWLWKNPS